MAIQIQTLFSATQSIYRLKCIAGQNALHNYVSWMYYTEDLSTLDFIRGGELVLTTGMSIGRKEDNLGKKDNSYVNEYLRELVTKLAELKASGLIVNVGKYIPDIPGEIVDLCNKINFPIFTLPWEIHTIDIMQDYGNRIVNEREKVYKLEQSLKDAIFNPQEFNIVQLENTAFENARKYSVLLLEFPEELAAKDEAEFYRYMQYSFNNKTGLAPNDYCFFIYKNHIIFVFHDDCRKAAGKIEAVARKDEYFKNMKIGISSSCSATYELPKEYEHAFLALKLCDENQLFCDYEDLGFFQILGDVKERKTLEKIYNQVLGGLNIFSEDKLHDYLNTLKLYLNFSGRVQKTADVNYTHRNTVNYRIKRICEVLDIDLSNGHTRFMIQVALYIKELLEKLDS